MSWENGAQNKGSYTLQIWILSAKFIKFIKKPFSLNCMYRFCF